MAIYHTTHVTLMQKLSGRNEARFVAGHMAVLGKTGTFATPALSRVADHSYLIATFRVSGDRRYYVGGSAFEVPAGMRDTDIVTKFWAKHANDLIAQATRFIKRNAVLGSPTPSILTIPAGSALKSVVVFNDEALSFMKAAGKSDYEIIDAFVKDINKYAKFFEFDGSRSAYEGTPDEKKDENVKKVAKYGKRMKSAQINAMTEIGGIVAKNGDWHLFKAMKEIADNNTAANVLLVGPSGCGKTSLPQAFADENGMNFLRMNCATIRDPEEWIGYREAKDGSTVFVKSEFIKAVEQGNTVIVLDEFNRVEPWLHNTLFPLLDHGRKTVAHNEEVTVGKGTIFAATANIGHKFTGTFVLDAALTNRFDATIVMGYLPEEQEAKVIVERCGLDNDDAAKIVTVIRTLRNVEKQLELGIDLSIRTSLKVATLFKSSNLSMSSIIDHVVLGSIQDENIMKKLLDAIMPAVKSLFEE